MDKQEKVASIEDLRELADCVDFWGHSGSWDSDDLHATIQFALQQAEKVEALERELSDKPQPVAVVVGKLGAGIRATAFEAAPRPELGQLLYDGPAAAVKLPPKSDVKMGGDVKTRSLLTGMNMMRKSCAEAIRAAGYEVEE